MRRIILLFFRKAITATFDNELFLHFYCIRWKKVIFHFITMNPYLICYPWHNAQVFKFVICYLFVLKYLWLHLKPLWSLQFDGKRSINMWRRRQTICTLVIPIYDLFSIHTSTRRNISWYCSVTYVKNKIRHRFS